MASSFPCKRWLAGGFLLLAAACESSSPSGGAGTVFPDASFPLADAGPGGVGEAGVDAAPDGGGGSASWTVQIGSSAEDGALAVAVDASGNVVLAGRTAGVMKGAHQGGYDVFVVKLASDGKELWRYQKGTATDDEATGVAIDASGDVVIVGTTQGDLFTTTNGGEDAFVAKLNGTTGAEMWGVHVGTTGGDEGEAVALDASGNVYIAGITDGGFQGFTNAGNVDAFAAKLAGSNGDVAWVYQIGSGSADRAFGIAIASTGHVVLGGLAAGALPAQSKPFGSGTHAFVVRLTAAGQHDWTRQFGSDSTAPPYDVSARRVAVGPGDDVWVVGETRTKIGNDDHAGGGDVFVARLAAATGATTWLRQVGTPEVDRPRGLALGADGTSWVVGLTQGDFHVPVRGAEDAFLVAFDPSGVTLRRDQIGSDESDQANAVALGSGGVVVLAGETDGTLGAQSFGDSDAFVTRRTY